MKKILLALSVALLASPAMAADRGIGDFPTLTTSATGDYFILSDVSNSNAYSKITFANLKAAVLGTGTTTGDILQWDGDSWEIASPDEITAGTGITINSGEISASAASSTAAGISELAIASEINTGTDSGRTITPDALAGSNLGTKDVVWMVKNSATATAVADGTEAVVIPSSMNGMNLIDMTAATASPNGGTGGSTTVVLRRVRTGPAMGDGTSQYDLTFSTPTVTVTWDGTGTNPNIANSGTSLQAGDEVDITGFATAANNGHWTVSTVGTNYFTFSNASGVENLNDTGVTITPTKHRNMTSTGATVAYTEYSASDETVDTSYDDIATGDRIYVDIDGITTTAGAKGLSVGAVFQLP